MYRGVPRVPPKPEGVAQVVDWWQLGDHAAVTDFVCLKRRNVVLDDQKREADKGIPRYSYER